MSTFSFIAGSIVPVVTEEGAAVEAEDSAHSLEESLHVLAGVVAEVSQVEDLVGGPGIVESFGSVSEEVVEDLHGESAPELVDAGVSIVGSGNFSLLSRDPVRTAVVVSLFSVMLGSLVEMVDGTFTEGEFVVPVVF